MKKIFFKFLLISFISITVAPSYAFSYENILANFIRVQSAANPDPIVEQKNSLRSTFLQSGKTNQSGLVLHYTMQSQTWPLNMQVCPSPLAPPHCDNIWRNDITIYVPTSPKTSTALLYLGADETTGQGHIDFAQVAAQTNTVVIALGNIPYQGSDDNGVAFPPFSDPMEYLGEDYLVAHTWNLFLQDPAHNAYMPNHLPMVFAAIQAMNFVQDKFSTKIQPSLNIENFIVAGASKRGWATWLTAVVDNRVTAIVPVVIDFLNTKANIQRMQAIFQNYYPLAYLPYYKEGISPNAPNFDELMALQDPLSYLATKPKGFTIAKYMVNASGDDIFLPDNSQNYIETLNKSGGANSLRYMVNTGHAFSPDDFVTYSLVPFMNRFLAKLNTNPLTDWTVTDTQAGKDVVHNLNIHFDTQPQHPVTLTVWQSTNTSYRDFRYACKDKFKNEYVAKTTLTTEANTFTYPIIEPTNAWSATYIELKYDDGYTVTTPVYVYPNTNPTVPMENVYSVYPPFPENIDYCAVLQPLPGKNK